MEIFFRFYEGLIFWPDARFLKIQEEAPPRPQNHPKYVAPCQFNAVFSHFRSKFPKTVTLCACFSARFPIDYLNSCAMSAAALKRRQKTGEEVRDGQNVRRGRNNEFPARIFTLGFYV